MPPNSIVSLSLLKDKTEVGKTGKEATKRIIVSTAFFQIVFSLK